MIKLTPFGKANFGLGVIFSILGTFLFIEKFNEAFVFEEQYLSLSFLCLGMALFFVSLFATNGQEDEEEPA
ncbi:hypothetical protein ACDX78_05860 [Virgibacillus oceani]